MKRLSIVVPIYNVEPYLERCLRSLEDQDISLSDYEIICINDGSTDGSRGIVTRHQKEFGNIIMIDQKNQGVSQARNRGIDLAKGRYLIMIDADDYVKPNILRERLDRMEKEKLDVGYTGYIILGKDMKEEYQSKVQDYTGKVMSGIEYSSMVRHAKDDVQLPHSSCAIFFRTDFLNSYNLRYLPDMPYLEDGELMARISCLAKNVIQFHDTVYIITTRSGSAMHSNQYSTEKARIGFLKAAKHLKQFQRNYCKEEKQSVFMNQHIVQFTIVYLIAHQGLTYLNAYSKLHSALKKGPLRKLDTRACNVLYRRLGNSYNVSIHCFYLNWFTYRVVKSLKIRMMKFLKKKA